MLEHLQELRMSHICIDPNVLSEKSYLVPRITQVKQLNLCQVSTWPKDSSSLYVETSLNESLWQTLSQLFPNLEQLNIRVKKSSISTIEQHLKLYFPHLLKSRVYSPDELIVEYFGRHKRYNTSNLKKCKGGKFFSECFFERINDL